MDYDKLTNLPPELRAKLKADAAQREAAAQANKSKFQEAANAVIKQAEAKTIDAWDKANRVFRPTDFVIDVGLAPNGQIDPKSPILAIKKIANLRGDTVYIRQSKGEEIPSQDQLTVLSDRITREESEFRSLDSLAQSRARNEGNPQFKSYLSNDALRQKFLTLKSAPKPY